MDNDLKKFFDEWKESDQRHETPEFPNTPKSRSFRWWYAAAAVLLISIAGIQLFQEQELNHSEIAQDSTQIELPVVTTETTDIYEWESPTGSLASDF
jgi:hypothetical protein